MKGGGGGGSDGGQCAQLNTAAETVLYRIKSKQRKKHTTLNFRMKQMSQCVCVGELGLFG